MVGNISTLTALDYLGFGLAPPTPSWELFSQGINNLDAIWIVSSVVAAVSLVLIMVSFIGGGHPGGVRSAQIYPLSVSGGALPGHIDGTLNEDAPSAGHDQEVKHEQ